MSELSDLKNTVCVMAAILEGTRSGQQWAEPSGELARRLADDVDEAFETRLLAASTGESN